MTQEALPFAPHTLARSYDPGTSHDAAHSAKELRKHHHELILSIMRRAPIPLSAEQIALLSGGKIDYVQVGKRLGELRRAEMIIQTDKQHRNKSGRKAYRYTINPIRESKDEAA